MIRDKYFQEKILALIFMVTSLFLSDKRRNFRWEKHPSEGPRLAQEERTGMNYQVASSVAGCTFALRSEV